MITAMTVLRAVSIPVRWTGLAGYMKYSPTPTGLWRLAANTLATTAVRDWNGPERQRVHFYLQRMLASKIMTRLEFRRDMSDQDVFPYRTGLLKDAQNTVTLGMIYAFSSADAK